MACLATFSHPNKCTTRVVYYPFSSSSIASFCLHKSPWQTKRGLSRCEPRARRLICILHMLPPPSWCEIHIKNLWKPGISSTRNKAEKGTDRERERERHLSRFLFDLSRHDKQLMKANGIASPTASASMSVEIDKYKWKYHWINAKVNIQIKYAVGVTPAGEKGSPKGGVFASPCLNWKRKCSSLIIQRTESTLERGFPLPCSTSWHWQPRLLPTRLGLAMIAFCQ